MSALLDVGALVAGYGGSPVVRGLNLSVGLGECVGITGPNGAGKSTLIRVLMGLIDPASGWIQFAGEDISGYRAERRVDLGMALVPEGRRVFPGLTVLENLEVASRQKSASRRAAVTRIFDLFPDLAERPALRAWQLSGGQQQMLAVGRALMTAPSLILMDEPTLGLAPVVAQNVMGAIGKIVERGTGVLITEQSSGRLGGAVTRILKLEAGILCEP